MPECRERALAQERAEKERQEMERKKERDQQLKKEMEKIREQVWLNPLLYRGAF